MFSCELKHQRNLICLRSYFIHGKADRVHVLTLAPVFAAVLLHERHQETARHLVILRIVILLQQRELKLGVDPKRVCADADLPLGPRDLFSALERGVRMVYVFGTHWDGSCSLRPCSPSSTCRYT